MISPFNSALLIWSVRDVLRRPWDAFFTGAALALVVGMLATALLLTESLAKTTTRLLAESPSLVVRRLNAGGWTPIPEKEGVGAALSVSGVIRAETRTWGVVRGPEVALTVVATPQSTGSGDLTETLSRLPGPGQAVIVAGVTPEGTQLHLRGVSGHEKTVHVVDTFDPGTSLFTHDIVLLFPEDARELLGIPGGQASDLVIEVFHAEEASAIVPDLVKAFPWPVQVRTRSESMEASLGGIFRRGSLVSVTMLPVVLALVLIVLATIRDRHARRYEIGLLKALGWGTRDVVLVSLYRALFISIPAVALGGAAAYALVFWTGAGWAGQWILGWRQAHAQLLLDTSGAVIVLLMTAALAFIPFVAAVLFPALRSASADVQDFMGKEAV